MREIVRDGIQRRRDQLRERDGTKSFDAHTDDARHARARAREDRVEVGIERDNDATIELGALEQLLVGRASQADVARVDDDVPAAHELGGGAAWEALIEQELQRSAGRRELNDAIVE